MRISLCGAAQEVTGSGYLVETATARVLVDFGMFQGSRRAEARNGTVAPVNPLTLDTVVATHAHLDHTGRLPLLPARGFRGLIHATPATVDFAQLVLADSARLQQADAARRSRRLLRAGKAPVDPLYGTPKVEALAPLFSALPYDERREIADGIEVRLVDAGHILGSSSVEMTVRENGRERVVAFSGDVGLKGSPILRDPTPLEHADLVFLESTYGDRDHRSSAATLEEFREILAQAVRQREKVVVRAAVHLLGGFSADAGQSELVEWAGHLAPSRPRFALTHGEPKACEALRISLRARLGIDAECSELGATISLE